MVVVGHGLLRCLKVLEDCMPTQNKGVVRDRVTRSGRGSARPIGRSPGRVGSDQTQDDQGLVRSIRSRSAPASLGFYAPAPPSPDARTRRVLPALIPDTARRRAAGLGVRKILGHLLRTCGSKPKKHYRKAIASRSIPKNAMRTSCTEAIAVKHAGTTTSCARTRPAPRTQASALF